MPIQEHTRALSLSCLLVICAVLVMNVPFARPSLPLNEYTVEREGQQLQKEYLSLGMVCPMIIILNFTRETA